MGKRALALGLLAALVLPAWVPSGASAEAPIDWTECGTEFKGECATIPVPVDWARPAGAKFDLAIGRLPALDPGRRIGILFVHPGGPGSSGINRYITGRGIPDNSPLRQVFDVVSVDPRGVGRSHPVVCSADLVAQTPATFPADVAGYRALLDFNGRLARDCRAHTGPLFDHVDTTSAVRDVDAIRAALGERQISFFAISYGTQVGQQYAELFPGRIRAMALDSDMDHSITSAFRYMQTTTEDFEGSVRTFAGWCTRTAACSLHGKDVLAIWDDLHTRARAGTLIDPATGEPLGAEALRVEAFLAMYNPASWFALSDRLSALTGGVGTARASAALAETVPNPYPAIWCSDWKWRVSGFAELDLYRRALERIYPHTTLSPFWADVTACLGWDGRVSNPQHRLEIRGAPTILLVTARFDVATPRAWNDAARQIRDSVLLSYDGVGHGQFRNSTCARTHIERYLITRTTPPPGTHCAAELPTEPPISASSTDAPNRPIHG